MLGVSQNLMKKIKKALISVSDKTNLKVILNSLKKYNIKIISSGGTYKKIKKLGFECTDVSEFTNFPEILSGRVKTLHPKIHAGILSRRNNFDNKQMQKLNFEEIDLVIVNFYPFETVIKSEKSYKKIIESIDIGGPSLSRAAAKNYESVIIISSINQYDEFVKELHNNNGSTTVNLRKKFSEEAFIETAYYDSVIANFFCDKSQNKFPEKKIFYSRKLETLRYGENPHQDAALYSANLDNKLNIISGKHLSFNNYNDLFSALSISNSLPKNQGTVIVKHNNPCGVSINKNKAKSYDLAYKCDPISAFGGIVSCNFKIDHKIAERVNKNFLEIIIGKGFTNDALKILRRKKNLRVIDTSKTKINEVVSMKSVAENYLIQTSDRKSFSNKDFVTVSNKKANKKTMQDLVFAFNISRYVKSNAIVLAKDQTTVGIGAGQTSRVDSCEIAINKMRKINIFGKNSNICAASDAFFPFIDGVEKLVHAGVNAIIQPSGSIRDQEIIRFANKLGIVLVFSKTRHFNH